jgi:hypothetical protein
MSIGTGIFLASLVIATVLLYGQTKDRWKRRRAAKRAGIALVVLVMSGGAIVLWLDKREEARIAAEHAASRADRPAESRAESDPAQAKEHQTAQRGRAADGRPGVDRQEVRTRREGAHSSKLASGTWSRELVVHRVKHARELELLAEAGITLHKLLDVVSALMKDDLLLEGAVGAHLPDLVCLSAQSM